MTNMLNFNISGAQFVKNFSNIMDSNDSFYANSNQSLVAIQQSKIFNIVMEVSFWF